MRKELQEALDWYKERAESIAKALGIPEVVENLIDLIMQESYKGIEKHLEDMLEGLPVSIYDSDESMNNYLDWTKDRFTDFVFMCWDECQEKFNLDEELLGYDDPKYALRLFVEEVSEHFVEFVGGWLMDKDDRDTFEYWCKEAYKFSKE